MALLESRLAREPGSSALAPPDVYAGYSQPLADQAAARSPLPFHAETVHELLLALESAGLEEYSDKSRLLAAFAAMQNYQIERAIENKRPRYQ